MGSFSYALRMNLTLMLARCAETRNAQTALYWGDQSFSYGDLWSRGLAVAGHLQDRLGVRPGDRVGLWLKNCPEFIFGLIGALQAGAVVVPINNFLKPDEVGFILNDAGCQVLLPDNETGSHTHRLMLLRPGLRVLSLDKDGGAQIASVQAPAAEKLPGSQRATEDLAVLIYTSGTTGHPKGAMLSHGNLLHNVESCRRVLDVNESDRLGVILPLFHSFMLTVGVLLPLRLGAGIVLVRSLHPARAMLQELFERQTTILPAIPQVFRSLAHAPGLPPRLPFRICISGAAPLPVQVWSDFTSRFSALLLEGYGLSEASPVVSLNPPQGPIKPGSIGRPIPDVEMSVQDDDGNHLPPGHVGEICVRGGNVMLGYWNQPEETARTLRNGWLLTGDVGYCDPDGFYYITDRKKDMLLVNGINVYPREIEEVLYQFPGVREAAVIGVPDARKGEHPVAFIAWESGIPPVEEKTLLHFLRERLADYKVPREIHFVPLLPRNATGKILKTALRQQVTRG